MARSVRLRWLMVNVNVLLTILGLSAAVALVVLTTYLRQQIRSVRTASEIVRLTETIRGDTLAYGWAGDLVSATHERRYVLQQSEVESDLNRHLREARLLVSDPTQVERLDAAEREIRSYLSARRQAASRTTALHELVTLAAGRLEASLDALDDLARANRARELVIQARARRSDSVARVLGLTVALLLVMGFSTVLVGMNELVFRPLLVLGRTIARFASGDRSARAPERGPTETKGIARTFNEMASDLVRQDQQRLEFLAGIAHDFRNPLSALKLSTDLLRPDRPLPPAEKLRATCALVNRQVGWLDRMIGDFLDSTRIQAGHLDLRIERLDLRDLLNDSVELYRSGTRIHELRLFLPDGPLVLSCDPARIEQVLNNLISNAIKYSPGGGRISVTLATEPDHAVISVEDQGIGISLEDQKHIFEPFRRTRPSREAAPGVGLGLSVTRRIVEAQGGSIEVESSVGLGSTFRVRLPFRESAGPRDRPAVTATDAAP